MNNDELAVKYLEQELKSIVEDESNYLVEGIVWAISRLKGNKAREDNFEREPTASFDEFKRFNFSKESTRMSVLPKEWQNDIIDNFTPEYLAEKLSDYIVVLQKQIEETYRERVNAGEI